MNKDNKLILKDSMSIDESYDILREYDRTGIKATRVRFIDDETGEVTQDTTNSVVIAGAQFTACKHFDIEPAVVLPNYNTELGITNMSSRDTEEFTYLFCCGNNGCGIEASQVYPVKYQSRIHPDNLIPFRYENLTDDLTDLQRGIYYGRKEFAKLNKVAYYYKAFDSAPQVYLKYADGTQIDSNIYNVSSTQRALTEVEIRLKITKSDFRDWYFANDGIENAHINSLSLLTAWEYTNPLTNIKYYNNVRPLTQLNFTNEWLIDLSKSITIVYQLFY